MIIGITGTLGAGKGAIVDYLVEKKGFVHYSSSDLLREMLMERDDHIDRDSLAVFGRQIRATDPAGVPKLTYERLKKDDPENAVLEALHSKGEAEFVRGIGGKIVGVDADVKTRYERITKRGSEKDNVTFEKFLAQTKREEASVEDATGHSIRDVLDMADAVIENNGSLDELHEKIERLLLQFSK